jgi:hypothetical protein
MRQASDRLPHRPPIHTQQASSSHCLGPLDLRHGQKKKTGSLFISLLFSVENRSKKISVEKASSENNCLISCMVLPEFNIARHMSIFVP